MHQGIKSWKRQRGRTGVCDEEGHNVIRGEYTSCGCDVLAVASWAEDAACVLEYAAAGPDGCSEGEFVGPSEGRGGVLGTDAVVRGEDGGDGRDSGAGVRDCRL